MKKPKQPNINEVITHYQVEGDRMIIGDESIALKNVANLMTIMPAVDAGISPNGLRDMHVLIVPQRNKQTGEQADRVVEFGSLDWCVARRSRLQVIALCGGEENLCHRCTNKPKVNGTTLCYDCTKVTNVRLLN